jgi:hypothetical protein
MKIIESYHLSPWEECVLLPDTLIEEEDCLVACSSKIMLNLPLQMKPDLDKCLGLRISILRTDTVYLMRILDEKG